MVVWDKQCNGATATVDGAGGPMETASNINSFRNLENSSRFVLLHDKTYNLNAYGAASTAGTFAFAEVKKNFSINLPKLNIPLEFSGATGGLTEIRSNNLLTIAITDEGTNAPTVEYISRIRYKDN